MDFSFLVKCEYVVLEAEEICSKLKSEKTAIVYKAWHDFWKSFFISEGISSSFNPMRFYQYDKVIALLYNNHVVTFVLISKHDRICLEERDLYLENFSKNFLQNLLEKRVKSIYSIQYLYLSSSWQSNIIGFNFCSVILSLALKHIFFDGGDACIAIARNDVGASYMCNKINFMTFDHSEMYNKPVEQMICTSPGEYPKAIVKRLVKEFWSRYEKEIYERNIKEVA